MSKVFLLGANVEIDTEIKTVGIGQIIRMEGYEYDNYVVADITHDSYGYSYRPDQFANIRICYGGNDTSAFAEIRNRILLRRHCPASFSVRMNCVPSYKAEKIWMPKSDAEQEREERRSVYVS